jgi:hypothetical protein
MAWIMNAVYATRLPIWSPRDEIAHFDYIDRLTDGAFPNPHADISPHTLALSTEHFAWIKPGAFDGTASSMGVAGKSYEAEQPPLYYALLAIPHRFLRDRVSPELDVRALRLLSLSFVLLATVLVLVTARAMDSFAPSLGIAGLIAALMLSVTNVASYATLGNDSLSALGGALALFFFVRALQNPESLLYPFSLATIVSISILLVKPTNAALLLAPLTLPAFSGQAASPSIKLRRLTAALGPLLPLPLCGFYRLFVAHSGFGSTAALEYFASWVKGIPSTPVFLRTLFCEALDLSHINIWAPRWVGLAFCGALLFALLYFAFTRSEWPPPASALTGVALGTTALTLIGAAVLNRWSPGVHWHAFRHYVGILPFLAVGTLAALSRLPRAWALTVLGASTALAAFVVAAQVGSILI